ncbi:3-dehydroquinate synthase [Ureibacillus acetophenoni]|uniref:3-dehydroquinate synthase n=1 Tax=Ureibacillus acetophenoni TaxID=614649 RepID=A0A285U6Z3_9BACL|nr:3-dehydroquinate synthase [Ureibacillus acetophenoni]SOC37710.1 3-dehydroquinate synthase [Ureibacillus acetophenoni]
MRIPVNTASHSYEVVIGNGILGKALHSYNELIEKSDQIIVLTDENVWEAQKQYFQNHISIPFEVYIMPPGETCKSFENYFNVQSFLLERNCTRKSLVLAFGGGAVGDVAGFVAATYMRGVPFIQIPTTILAHDSAVGGKTAINHPQGKNMIGAFYQPQAVIYDTQLLTSLSEKEIRSGMAEVVKHALISNNEWLQDLMQSSITKLDSNSLAEHLKKGIEVKAKIVEEDETEQSVRKYLNFGHTYGHAIEAAAGYGGLSHGEAVMIGTVYALLLSSRYGQVSKDFSKQFLQFAHANGYPIKQVFQYTFDTLKPYLLKDKKNEYGVLKFVLLEEVGKPFVQSIEVEECKEVDQEFRNLIQEVCK